jgi:hypothetical protein
MSIPLADGARLRDCGACRIALHKPLSLATALWILETPIRHPLLDHEKCKQRFVRRTPGIICSRGTMSCCRAKQYLPAIRPIDSIRVVHLEDGAYLYETASPVRDIVETDITLWSTTVFPRISFPEPGDEEQEVGISKTSIALLQLAVLQRRPGNLVSVEKQRFLAEQRIDSGVPVYSFEQRYQGWNCRWMLSIELGLAAAKALVDTVSPVSIVTSRIC